MEIPKKRYTSEKKYAMANNARGCKGVPGTSSGL